MFSHPRRSTCWWLLFLWNVKWCCDDDDAVGGSPIYFWFLGLFYYVKCNSVPSNWTSAKPCGRRNAVYMWLTNNNTQDGTVLRTAYEEFMHLGAKVWISRGFHKATKSTFYLLRMQENLCPNCGGILVMTLLDKSQVLRLVFRMRRKIASGTCINWQSDKSGNVHKQIPLFQEIEDF